MKNHKNKIYLLLLFLILVPALAIRYKGIWFGYPLPVHPDEPWLVGIALRMINTGDLNPHWFIYPTLNIYLQSLLYRVVNFSLQVFYGMSIKDIPEIWYYIAGRSFNVFISIMTIIVTFEIGRRLVSPILGLMSAWFIGASVLHINNSFMITVDTSVAFWTSLSTLMAIMIYSKGKKPCYYLLGGIFVGLAISSKYTAFVSVAPILIAHFKMSRKNRDWVDKNIMYSLLVIPIAFLITTPYALLDYETFFSTLRLVRNWYASGHPGLEAAGTMSFHLYGNYLVKQGYGLLPILFSGFGLIWFLSKDPWKAAMLLSTPLLLFLFVGLYKVFAVRNIVAVIPFLSLFSGAFIFAVHEWLKRRLSNWGKTRWMTLCINILIVAVLVGSTYTQVLSAINHVQRITLPDTRWVSIQWIKQHLPSGSYIGRERYTPPIEKYSQQYLVHNLGFFAVARKPEEVKKLDYMIVSSKDYGRFLKSPDMYPDEARSYIDFFENHELVYELVPDDEKLGGPKISIYKIKKRRSEK